LFLNKDNLFIFRQYKIGKYFTKLDEIGQQKIIGHFPFPIFHMIVMMNQLHSAAGQI